MPSLQNLHVRFPTTLMPQLAPHNTSITPSLANIPPAPPGPPPPIDITGIVQATSQISHYHGLHHHHGNHQPMISHQHGTVKSSLTAKKLGFFKAPNMTRGFSLFSGLKSLAALDVDSLECVPELAQCISSSSSSVRSLKLSISDRLALKARGKNSADVSDSESTSDVDDWAPNHPNVAALPHGAFNDPAPAAGTSSAPASNTIDVCRARAAQEAILAQLFGLEEVASQRHFDQVLEDAVLSGDGKAQLGPKPLSKAEEDRNFVQVLRQMARILPAAVYSGSGSSRSLKALNLIERATIRYLEQADKSGNQSGKETASTSSGDAQTPEEMPKAAQASDPPGLIGLSNVPGPSDGLSGYIAAANAAISASSQIYQGPSDVPSVIWASQVDKADDNLSDIVDMEHPDDTEGAGEDQEFLDADEDEHVSNVPKPTVGHEATAGVGQSKGKEAVRELKNVTSGAVTGSKAHMGQSLEEYIRSTHGIPLDSLSLHLIPVKATVLCRAVDAFALKHLSLLNVGPQRILWAMLARLHQIRPLQLTSIHTDNVTPSFLSFVNGLDRVTELFLFECSNKTRVEPFAAKTTVKIEEIRQQVLTKHIKSMQRLVIRNDDDSNWALNAPAARLIAVHGSNLIELAVGLNTSSYVSIHRMRFYRRD